MKQENNRLPNPNDWENTPIPIQLYIAWQTFNKAHLPKIKTTILKHVIRVDLWLFPTLAFIGCFKAISKIMPDQHPMTFNAIMASSLMCATLTLFIIRPKNKKSAHWINQEGK